MLIFQPGDSCHHRTSVFNIEPYGKMNNRFFFEIKNRIAPKLYMDGKWVVPYTIDILCLSEIQNGYHSQFAEKFSHNYELY